MRDLKILIKSQLMAMVSYIQDGQEKWIEIPESMKEKQANEIIKFIKENYIMVAKKKATKKKTAKKAK